VRTPWRRGQEERLATFDNSRLTAKSSIRNREVEGKKGSVWKIDVETGQMQPLIPNSAQFLVIATGPNAGSIVASQRTVSHNSSGPQSPHDLITAQKTHRE